MAKHLVKGKLLAAPCVSAKVGDNIETLRKFSMILSSKIATALGWLAILTNWISPLGVAYPYLHWTGIFLLLAHTIEAVVFMPKARQAGGNLPLHILQLFIFGYPHAMQLDQNIAARKA